MKQPTQNDRVLRALRIAGARGICQTDFFPPVVDGGKPITRLAARVYELRERGFPIRHVGERNSVAVYVLSPPPVGVVVPFPQPTTGTTTTDEGVAA